MTEDVGDNGSVVLGVDPRGPYPLRGRQHAPRRMLEAPVCFSNRGRRVGNGVELFPTPASRLSKKVSIERVRRTNCLRGLGNAAGEAAFPKNPPPGIAQTSGFGVDASRRQ